jgi:Kef-type K+ transport system membrane component KefB
VALTFSSTIIMVKLLSEKNDLGSLYGKISVGFLLVQDFVAVIILMFLASLGTSGFEGSQYAITLAKAVGLFAVIWLLSKKVLPRFFDKVLASSTELLFIASIAWALGVAGFVAGPLGFSLEIGGFLAGIALSGLPEHLQIGSRTRPLRDFFLTMFFLLLGAQLVVGGSIGPIIIPALIFSIFVLVGNPIIVLVIMGILGYKRRTSFLAGLTVAQISEFSLILMSMGLALGHLTQYDVSTVVLVGVITMTVSTYLILGADKVYERIKHWLAIFERSRTKEVNVLGEEKFEGHIVLVGCDRTGRNLVKYFNKKGWPFLVVDFNPKVFQRLTAENTPVIFGDINDPDILEATFLDKAKMVISTTSNLGDNLSLLEHLKTARTKAALIFTSQTKADALKLYEKGASYVIVPDVVAGEHIRHLLRVYGTKGKRLIKAGKSHFNRLIFT